MDLSSKQLLIVSAFLSWYQFLFKFASKAREFIDNVGRTVIKYFAHDNDDNNNNNK
jgi:hypothetical protein